MPLHHGIASAASVHGHAASVHDHDKVIVHGNHNHTAEDTRHDSGYIFLVLMFTMAIAQIGVYVWKKRSPKTFNLTTLTLLWIFPFLLSAYSLYWRFVLVWLIFSCRTASIIMKARKKQLEKRTLRTVYQWFSVTHKLCYFGACSGYGLVMLEASGLSDLLPKFLLPTSLSPFGFVLLFYGLYFGVLGRDCAVYCADTMASTMGYIKRNKAQEQRMLGSNTCAICDCDLYKNVRLDLPDETNAEKIFTLECEHQFHEDCLRGWTLIGKRDTCAYCCEKVDLKKMFSNPWDAQHIAWGTALDMLRYMIVFHPILLILCRFSLLIFY